MLRVYYYPPWDLNLIEFQPDRYRFTRLAPLYENMLYNAKYVYIRGREPDRFLRVLQVAFKKAFPFRVALHAISNLPRFNRLIPIYHWCLPKRQGRREHLATSRTRNFINCCEQVHSRDKMPSRYWPLIAFITSSFLILIRISKVFLSLSLCLFHQRWLR